MAHGSRSPLCVQTWSSLADRCLGEQQGTNVGVGSKFANCHSPIRGAGLATEQLRSCGCENVPCLHVALGHVRWGDLPQGGRPHAFSDLFGEQVCTRSCGLVRRHANLAAMDRAPNLVARGRRYGLGPHQDEACRSCKMDARCAPSGVLVRDGTARLGCEAETAEEGGGGERGPAEEGEGKDPTEEIIRSCGHYSPSHQ